MRASTSQVLEPANSRRWRASPHRCLSLPLRFDCVFLQVVITCDQPGPTTSSPLPLWTVDFGRPLQQANPLSLFRVAGVYRCATAGWPHAYRQASTALPSRPVIGSTGAWFVCVCTPNANACRAAKSARGCGYPLQLPCSSARPPPHTFCTAARRPAPPRSVDVVYQPGQGLLYVLGFVATRDQPTALQLTIPAGVATAAADGAPNAQAVASLAYQPVQSGGQAGF